MSKSPHHTSHCGASLLCVHSNSLCVRCVSLFSPADVPPAGPMDLPLSLLEMGCSGRFELITHPLPGQPLAPHSTVCTGCTGCTFTFTAFIHETFVTGPSWPGLPVWIDHVSRWDLKWNEGYRQLNLSCIIWQSFTMQQVIYIFFSCLASLVTISSLPPQLPHGLPPTSLNLETEVEKLFLRDPSWLPIHDIDFAFQKFLKYVCLWCCYCWWKKPQ